MSFDEGVLLSRHTTIGTGGPARAFARPRTLAELGGVVREAAARGLAVVTVGLGSNVLVADEGVDALVLRLEGHPAIPPFDDAGARVVGEHTA